MSEVECPACKGSGKSMVFHNTGADYRKHFSTIEACTICSGSGKATTEEAAKIQKRNDFWDKLLKERD